MTCEMVWLLLYPRSLFWTLKKLRNVMCKNSIKMFAIPTPINLMNNLLLLQFTNMHLTENPKHFWVEFPFLNARKHISLWEHLSARVRVLSCCSVKRLKFTCIRGKKANYQQTCYPFSINLRAIGHVCKSKLNLACSTESRFIMLLSLHN